MGVSRNACSSFMTALVVYHGYGDLHHVFDNNFSVRCGDDIFMTVF